MHGKQSHSSNFMNLLECLHDQFHVSSPHRLPHICLSRMRVKMSHPDSRSDPIGGSDPSLGCETIYWDTLPDFFFKSRTCTCGYDPYFITESKYHIHSKRTTTGVVSIKIYTHLSSPIYKYKTVLLHLQIRAQNLL